MTAAQGDAGAAAGGRHRPTGADPAGAPPTPAQTRRRRPARPSVRARMPSGFATTRDLLSFIFGMVIIGNEVFVQDTPETYVLGLGIALTGLPIVFGADEKGKK